MTTTFINNVLITCDHVCDYTPLVSTLSNAIILIAKPLLSKLDPTTISTHHYFKHIQEKDSCRSLLLHIPFLGNIYFIYYDFISKPALLEKIKTCNYVTILDLLKGISFLYQRDREVALEAVKKNGHALKSQFKSFNNDKALVLEAIRQNIFALQWASDELKNNTEVVLVVLEAIKQDARPMQWASDRLKNDKKFISKIIEQNGWLLEHASPELRNNEEFQRLALKQITGIEESKINSMDYKELLLEAVKKNGQALMFATETFKNDEEIVLAAVRKDGCSLKYASNDCKNNKNILLEAIKNDSQALLFASDHLEKDPEIIMATLESIHRRNDESGILRVKLSPIKYTNENLKNDKNFVLEALQKKIYFLKDIGHNLRNDKEIMLEAVKQEGSGLLFASDNLKNDVEVCATATINDIYALQFCKANLNNVLYKAWELSPSDKTDFFRSLKAYDPDLYDRFLKTIKLNPLTNPNLKNLYNTNFQFH